MAKKPTILQAQSLPFSELFGACMVDAGKRYLRAAGVLGALIGVVVLLVYGGAIAWSFITAMVGSLSFGYVGNLIVMAASAVWGWVSAVWAVNVAIINGSYTLTENLLPGVLKFTLIACHQVGQVVDGKKIFTQVCDGASTIHFPAAGVWLGLVLAESILALLSVFWMGARLTCKLKRISWDADDWEETWKAVLIVVIPVAFAFAVFICVSAGFVQWLGMPVFKRSFNAPVEYEGAFSVSYLLVLVLFLVPCICLQILMHRHVEKARIEAVEENQRIVGDDLHVATKDLLTEPFRMFWYRSGVVTLGGVAFLAIMYLGTQICSSWLGFLVSAVIAVGVVGVSLACVITCYPSLKEGYQRLQQERERLLAKREVYSAECPDFD